MSQNLGGHEPPDRGSTLEDETPRTRFRTNVWRCYEQCDVRFAVGNILDVISRHRVRNTHSVIPVGFTNTSVPYPEIADAVEKILRPYVFDMCPTPRGDPLIHDNPHSILLNNWIDQGVTSNLYWKEVHNGTTHISRKPSFDKLILVSKGLNPYDKIRQTTSLLLNYGLGYDTTESFRRLTKIEYFDDEHEVANIKNSVEGLGHLMTITGKGINSYISGTQSFENAFSLVEHPDSTDLLQDMWPPSHKSRESFLAECQQNNLKAAGVLFSSPVDQTKHTQIKHTCVAGIVQDVQEGKRTTLLHVQFGLGNPIPTMFPNDAFTLPPSALKEHVVRVINIPWHSNGSLLLLGEVCHDRGLGFRSALWNAGLSLGI